MYDLIRIRSKEIAKQVFSANFGTIFLISLIINAPVYIIGILSQSISILNVMAIENLELYGASETQILAKILENMFIQLGLLGLTFVVTILIFPLVIGANLAFKELILGKKAKVSGIFEMYSAGELVKKSFGLLWSIFVRSILPTLCIFVASFLTMFSTFYFVITIIFGELAPTQESIIILLLGISSIPLWIIGVYFLAKLRLLQTLSTICLLDDGYTVKKGNKVLTQAFKGKQSLVFIYSITFAGWMILSSLLSTITFGISTFVFSSFYTISTIVYVKTYYDNEINKNHNN